MTAGRGLPLRRCLMKTPGMQNPDPKRFGRYEIVAELGRGAMGVVYKARDPQIDRLVAVKTVSLHGQNQAEEQEFRRRFMNEAQAAGRLHHAGIVSIFDVGEHDIGGDPGNCEPYIVLEYVAGEALNRILAREKKIPLATALQLAEEIAEALAYAHAQGVVHRDIKPGNILVTEDGHPKIADFGIAKMNLAHFTVPGRVLGTPAYMAPEQLSGEGVDARSDLFSLGVILYAMTTGQSPFHGDSATTVCFKVANREPIAASALDLNLPPELDQVIARAMAKDREHRYQSGAEFAEDLRQLQLHFSTKSKTGSTTTSLAAAASTGIRATGSRTGKTAQAGIRPVAAVEQARTAVHTMLRKAPIRDLILGAATLLLLVIVGAQLKLLKTSSRPDANSNPNLSGATSVSPPTVNFDSAPPSATTAAAAPPAAVQAAPAATSIAPQKARAHVRRTAKPVIVASSTLDLAVQHQFVDATLYVWVDDKLTLTRTLHGGAQKKLVVFNGVRGVDSETLKIPAGEHALRLRALSADRTIDLSKTVSAEFVGGDDKRLQVTFDKHNTSMRLTWQ
jgi:eukaryotic-like serine/threonine-protein kinase